MNILIVNLILSTAEKGKITRRDSNRDCMIYSFARGFVADGHRVTLCASSEYKALKDESNDFEVLYFDSRLTSIFNPSLIPCPIGLRSYVKANIDNFDFVIASEMFQVATLGIASLCKNKLVVWQELSIHNRFCYKIPSKLWYNIVIRFSALKEVLVVPRSENARTFIKRYSSNVTEEIVDHGADCDMFKPVNECDSMFVVVAQLIKRKNIDRIIRIFSDFVKLEKYREFVLHVIGDGPERENLYCLIDDLKLKKNVIMHGYMTHRELTRLSARSYGLLVDTSRDLNMVTIPESIVNGTPVLMNTIPNTASMIDREKLGIVKDNWSSEELIKMVKNYDLFRENCISIRDRLTNVGCSRRMIEIYKRYRENDNF